MIYQFDENFHNMLIYNRIKKHFDSYSLYRKYSMATITQKMITRTYDFARLVVDEGMLESEAAGSVANETGMNLNSSKMYMHCAIALLNGGQYGWTVNGRAMEYFFEKILSDYGPDKLKMALNVFDSHAEKNQNSQLNLKRVADRFRDKLHKKNI